MTVPDAAARIGEPYVAPMSIPSCIRPQRQPNGLVTGPEAGQIMPPEDDDVAGALPDEARAAAAAACAARIWSPRAALEALSASISDASACSCALSVSSATSLCSFDCA